MAVTAKNSWVKMTAAADAFANKLIVQSIVLTSGADAAAATLTTTADEEIIVIKAGAAATESVIFPNGLIVNGLKLSALTGTSPTVYVYYK